MSALTAAEKGMLEAFECSECEMSALEHDIEPQDQGCMRTMQELAFQAGRNYERKWICSHCGGRHH